MLNNLESAPVRIIKPPPPHSFSAARASASGPGPSSSSSGGPSVPHQSHPPPAVAQQQAAQAETATGAPGPAPASAGPRADQPRMATIQEDTTSSSDSLVAAPSQDNEFPEGAVFPLSSGPPSTARSFQDLNEPAPSPGKGERKRLKRQACIDSKETEC